MMESEYSKDQCSIRSHRLSKIRSGITIVCIADSISIISLINNELNNHLRDSNHHYNIVHCRNFSKWMKYMKQAPSYERIIILLVFNEFDANLLNVNIEQINQYQQVQSLLIIYHENNTDLLTKIKIKTEKLVSMYDNYQSASDHLQRLINEFEQLDDGSLIKHDKKEKSLKDIRQNFIEFLSTHSYRVILTKMSYKSSEAKREMLNEIHAVYRGKSKPLLDIDRFSRTYISTDAINWYTKSCFLYSIVNRALRTEDIRALYIFRYFIIDLSLCLKPLAIQTRTVNHHRSFICYRGSLMSREEIEQWDVNMLVATNTFWSSSRDLSVAKTFAGIDLTTGMSPSRSREDKRQHVLFEIQVDFQRSPQLILADVSHLSAFKDEHEMLFDLGTPFYITNKTDDDEHYIWKIQMMTTSEIDTFDYDYNLYIHQRLVHTQGLILYGNLLAGALCNYKEAVIYFQRLLRILPMDDENRSNIYCELGRVYRFMGKYQQAIEYFRAALLLQRRSLPQTKFDYGRTLSGLGVVYSEIGNFNRAIHLHEHALSIYRTLFPENHLEMNQILSRLAYDLYINGQYERAFRLLSKVDISLKGKMFLTNPQTQLYFTLGLLHKAFGNRIQAIGYLKQALDLREKWSHKYHPYTARICYELSLLYAEENNQGFLALKYAQRALDIRQIAKMISNKYELKQSIVLVERLSQSNNLT